jgi:hypothetical protein
MADRTGAQADVLAHRADLIVALVRPHPVRVGVDGYSASGKTTLADALMGPIESRGRPCLRASLDTFKRPRAERHRYDRESGAGYGTGSHMSLHGYCQSTRRAPTLRHASERGDGTIGALGERGES